MWRAMCVVACVALMGCGPSLSVTRMKVAPAKPANCELKFVEVDMATITVKKEWTILGYVTLGESGVQDPFSERYRALVRPKACEMGGEAVALGLASAQAGMMASGSGVMYAVLKPYEEATGEASKF